MSITERTPTRIAECGCPYDPEYDEGSLGWHLVENHPETWFRLRTPFGTIRQPTEEECLLVGRDLGYAKPGTIRDYRELGDYVIERYPDDEPETLDKLAALCEWLSLGDDVHVLPGVGVYIEE